MHTTKLTEAEAQPVLEALRDELAAKNPHLNFVLEENVVYLRQGKTDYGYAGLMIAGNGLWDVGLLMHNGTTTIHKPVGMTFREAQNARDKVTA